MSAVRVVVLVSPHEHGAGWSVEIEGDPSRSRFEDAELGRAVAAAVVVDFQRQVFELKAKLDELALELVQERKVAGSRKDLFFK